MTEDEDYRETRQFYADRLQKTLQETGEQAERNGMTEAQLEDLLADES